MNNILILPSWYASKEAPTSGSFFREQSELMEKGFIIQVWVSEKFWISKRRFFYNKLFQPLSRFQFRPIEISPPQGKIIIAPFCARATDSENLNEEIEAFVQLLKKQKEETGFYPDLIHAHCSFKAGIVARGISKELNIPYILTEHLGPFLLHKYNTFWKEKIIESLEDANSVMVVSEHQKQQLLMHEINCNPLVTGNLVDDSNFQIRKTKNIKSRLQGVIVTYYPNFIKDMDTFFKTMLLIKQNCLEEEFSFIIVGGGETQGTYDQNYYEKKINELSLRKFVRVVPTATRQEMSLLLQTSDFLISTSIAETFGVALCEAMLCGKPVISTKNGGVADYANPDNSILIPIRDTHALFEALKQLKENYTMFAPEQIRHFISSKYGREAFFNRMNSIYLNAIKK